MELSVQGSRATLGLTQAETATMLGVSQTYICLLEKGQRRISETLAQRLAGLRSEQDPEAVTNLLRFGPKALGCLGFAHHSLPHRRPQPSRFLLSVLSSADVDARIVETLHWGGSA